MAFGDLRKSFLSTVRTALCGRQAAPAVAVLPREQELIAQFRAKLPAECATARAIDRGEPWHKIAQYAVDGGYVDFAEKLSRAVEARLRCDA